MDMGKFVPVWEKSGLDPKAMLGSAKVRNAAYTEVYLSQKNRPQSAAKFLDYAINGYATDRVEELYNAKTNGQKLIGTLCVYVPDEIIYALNAISMALCAGSEAGFVYAENYLPRNTCSLIKAFWGLTFLKICPFIELADLIIGETTCDGKKKAYDIYSGIKNMHIMEIPHCKRDSDKKLIIEEFKLFAAKMEELTGNKLSIDSLKRAIKTVNERRRAIMRMMEARTSENPPISGKDALLIHQFTTLLDAEKYTETVNSIADELEERVSKNVGVASPDTPRILITGCPMAMPNWKLYNSVEKLGGIIVCEEGCVGMRSMRNETSDDGNTVEELIENIADRYFKIDCACFTPNNERIDNIIEMAKHFKADGVINYALMFCTPFAVENYRVEEALKKAGIPSLTIETDYSKEDIGQINLRVEAFLEMLKTNK